MKVFMVRRIFDVTWCMGLLLCWSSVALSQDLPKATFTVIGWNVESGGANPNVIADQIGDFQNCDLWGLSEVANPRDAAKFAATAGLGEDRDKDGQDDTFEVIVGTTGGGDRLAIIYNTARLDLIDKEELHHINANGTHRAPLVARFKGKDVPQEFLFMVNHLARGNNSARHAQASLLNTWATQQTIPVIAVGDYNFDYKVVDGHLPGNRDRGFDNMTANGVFTWIEPTFLVKTQASPRFNTVLDFVFVSQPAFGWTASSVILVTPGDFPDTNQTSDHRPVLATFELVAEPSSTTEALTPSADDLKRQLLGRIESLEAELQELKRLIQSLSPNP